MVCRLWSSRWSWPAPPAMSLPPAWWGTQWPGSGRLSRQEHSYSGSCRWNGRVVLKVIKRSIGHINISFSTMPGLSLPLGDEAKSERNAWACGTPERSLTIFFFATYTYICTIVETDVVGGWSCSLCPYFDQTLARSFCPDIHLGVLYSTSQRYYCSVL